MNENIPDALDPILQKLVEAGFTYTERLKSGYKFERQIVDDSPLTIIESKSGARRFRHVTLFGRNGGALEDLPLYLDGLPHHTPNNEAELKPGSDVADVLDAAIAAAEREAIKVPTGMRAHLAAMSDSQLLEMREAFALLANVESVVDRPTTADDANILSVKEIQELGSEWLAALDGCE